MLYEVKAGVVYFVLCSLKTERFRDELLTIGRYINPASFTFLYLFTAMDMQHNDFFVKINVM